MMVPPLERFMLNVAVTRAGCWEWQRATRTGYGRFMLPGGDLIDAHRYAYEQFVGPIPEELELDHLCRNKACVRPSHLEAVTHAENVQRVKNLTHPSQPPIALPAHVSHGEYRAYSKCGCRCDQCRWANRQRYHARKARKAVAA